MIFRPEKILEVGCMAFISSDIGIPPGMPGNIAPLPPLRPYAPNINCGALVLHAKNAKPEKKLRPSAAQKAKAKADYKRFLDNDENKRLVFYSESSGFYKYFKGVIEYIIENSDITVDYITSDPDDQVFALGNPRIRPYYIDDNRLIVLFMKIKAEMVVMTMPDLQQFHLKRSLVKKDVEYVYMFHYPLSTTMVLRRGALSYYDTIFCVGGFQFDEIRQTESYYDLPEKNLIAYGYTVLEDMQKRFDEMEKAERGVKKILIAPSWQEGNILDSCIHGMLGELLGNGYSVVVRPHPEYVKRYGANMDSIVGRYSEYKVGDLSFELDFSDSSSIFDSDVVISDWSGTAYEAAFVTKRPVVFINTPPKVNNPEYGVIEVKPLEMTLRDEIGVQIDPEHMEALRPAIEELLKSSGKYAARITQIRDTYIANFGRSAEVGGKYIIDKLGKGGE